MTYVEYGQEQKPIFKHSSIQLELRFSKTNKAFFLDVTISLTDGFLSTNLYSKPTNKHMYENEKKIATVNVEKNIFSLDVVTENAQYGQLMRDITNNGRNILINLCKSKYSNS